jgi:DNA-binding transcriptional LysR family regulator
LIVIDDTPSTLGRMSELDLRHLATLAAIAEEGSFGRAAARLGYTQSTVSQQISALEKAVGGALFDRPGGPKPVRITPLGTLVLTHGRDLLAGARAMADAVDRFNAGDGRVDIGTFQSVSNVLLPPIVRRLRDEHPGCDIRLVEDESDPPKLLADLDLLFFDGRIDGRGGDAVEHRKLLDDPYLLVARRGDFPDGPVRLAQLHDVPMVAYPPVCDQARVEQTMARRGIRPRIVFRTGGNEAIVSMVRAGLGSAILPRLTVAGANAGSDETLRIHHLRPALPPREIYLHWNAGRTHSPLAARTIEIAVETASRITQDLSA